MNDQAARKHDAQQIPLETAAAQLMALNEAAIVAFTDPLGRITFANDMFCKVSGYSKEELIGQDHRIVNSGHHPKSFFIDLWRKISSGLVWRGEICNRAKNGALYWVDTSIAPTFDKKNKIIQYVAVRFLITDRKKAEEELLRSNAELEQFAYIASHDLQAPLRQIISFINLLAKAANQYKNPDIEKWMGFITDGGTQMRRLIDDLLSYSRVRMEPTPMEVVSLSALLKKEAAGVAAINGATVEIDNLPDVVGYPTQLWQLFHNLIQNALKFRRTDIPPVIKVFSEDIGDSYVISVADNGIGIEKKHFDRIFQIFQRLHPKGVFEGTGIGLAVCKKVAELHGGRIWVESTFGQGTTFHVAIKKLAIHKAKE